ncbi:5545_t:CDS:2 [Diversispora eburnea]|uniref:5545_t:CDS:1 n=1 Tax=Diversispora eburnea TaxID=1213867 RepID=A0A9N8V1Y3_9GLOM|nr:5545_t:CDS:2 [Diversispora eburnea]
MYDENNPELKTISTIKRARKDSSVSQSSKFFDLVIELFRLPDRRTLSDRILREAADLNNSMIDKLKSDRVGVTLPFDGWVNFREQELIGTVLMSSDGQPYICLELVVNGKKLRMLYLKQKK